MSTRSFGPSLAGLVVLIVSACAAPAPRAAPLPLPADEEPVLEVLVEGTPAPRFSHAGQTYVLGKKGERYVLRIWNRSWRRIEAVISVDGRDVMDGKPADYRSKRGYIVAPYNYVDVEGWRLSAREVAAFRFARVPESYAARTGSARNVGVIGVAIFPERIVGWYQPHRSPHWLAPRHSAAPTEEDGAESSAPAPSAAEADGKSDAARASGRAPQRPGLGTEFGEAMNAPIREVAFIRETAHTPARLLTARYNDRAGLVAIGIDVDGLDLQLRDQELRLSADPFPLSSRAYASPPPGWRR